MTDQMEYGFDALTVMPPHMGPWNNHIELPSMPSKYGEYVLVEASAADIELHHQVTVLDESGDPLRGIWVIFGFPGGQGPKINLPLTMNLWRGKPAVLVGNAQRTNGYGYCQHTVGEGGEDIWVYDVNPEGQLLYPSPIIKNNIWIGTGAGAPFEHTGVHLTFQRRDVNVVPKANRLKSLEERVASIEMQLSQMRRK